MLFFQDLLEFDYLRRTVLAILFASIACGIMGSYVVARRQSYLIGAIAHSLLGGIGLARYLQITHHLTWFSTLLGSLLAATLASIAISILTLRNRMRQDTILSAIWTLGVAIGISFIAMTPGYAEDLNSYLFGSILLVAPQDLLIMGVMTAVIVIMTVLFHSRFLSLCFNEEALALRGISTGKISFLLHLMIAVTTVLLSQIVGIVLVLVLLVIPAATAGLLTRRIVVMMTAGTAFCLFFCFGGLIVSYQANWPIGATIVELAVATYLLIAMLCALNGKWHRALHCSRK